MSGIGMDEVEPSSATSYPDKSLQQEKQAPCYASFPWSRLPRSRDVNWSPLAAVRHQEKSKMKRVEFSTQNHLCWQCRKARYHAKKKKNRVRKEMLQVVITQSMQGKGSFVFPVLAILLSQTFIPLMAPKLFF